jgi:hypothetical protein
MNQASILFPMFGLVALTFAVLLMIPYARFTAGRRKQVAMDDFKYGESVTVPPQVSLPNRNMMNLLELPLLFYVACPTLYVTGTANESLVWLAWLYVALRAGHSLVHLTYNKVAHRLSVYAASNVVLGIIWMRLLSALVRGA